MKNYHSFLVALFFFCALAPGFAQSPMSVDEIVDQFVENSGGEANWEAVKNMKVLGKSINQGVEYPVTLYRKRPNLERLEVRLQGDMKIVEAFDGEVAWGINPFAGQTEASKMGEEASREAATNYFEPELINYKEKGHEVTYEGIEEVDGTDLHKIKVVTKDGNTVHYLMDMDYFVPIVERRTVNTGAMKGMQVEMYWSDYKELEGHGVVMPHAMEQKVNGQTQIQFVADKYEVNVDLGEEDFAFPEKK